MLLIGLRTTKRLLELLVFHFCFHCKAFTPRKGSLGELPGIIMFLQRLIFIVFTYIYIYVKGTISSSLLTSVFKDSFRFWIDHLPSPAFCLQMLMMETQWQILWPKSENVVSPSSLLLSHLTGRTTESIWLTPQVLLCSCTHIIKGERVRWSVTECLCLKYSAKFNRLVKVPIISSFQL